MKSTLGVALFLVASSSLVKAIPVDLPLPGPRKQARISPSGTDDKRYIGVTIFNFESDPRVDDERIEHSALAGCNAVEITINWDQIYPATDSRPMWDVVDSHVQTAQRLGLKIALRVHVGREFERLGGFWTVHETMQAADSSRRAAKGIIQFSFSHQPTVDRASTFVSEVANRYHYLQEQGQLLFFSVVVSPALESEYSPVYDPPTGAKYVVPYDYSIHELTAFRTYLQARFSLSQLNQRWGTDFSQWNRVMPPPNDKSNPYASQLGTRGNDWYVFRHRQLKAFIDQVNQTVKAVDPAIVMVNQHGCVWDRLSGLRATLAFKNLGQTADGLKFNDGPDYNHRFSMDLVRSNLKPGAFMINAVDGMFHNSVSLEKYYEQIAQCFEHGAKMLTLANFGGKDARQKLTDLIAMVTSRGLLGQPVTQVQTAGNAIGYKLSDILKNNSIAQERWNQRYSQNGNKPVRIEIDEDLLRNEPPVLNSLPILKQPIPDQTAMVGEPFSYSIGQPFSDADGTIVGIQVSGLPEGIRWVSATGELAGTPTRAESRIVTLIARDNLDATVTASFRLTVADAAGTNQPPVAPVIGAQTGQVGKGFTYTLPPFTDPEELPLTYKLAGIAPGLSFSSQTGTISGVPTTAGVYSLTYSAADPSNRIGTTLVQLTINEAAPVIKRTGNFEGYLDTYTCEGDIWGWVWDRNLPNTPLPIEVLDGSNVIGTFTADVVRPDLVAVKKGNGQHGYQFIIPASIKDGLPHVISLRIENSDYYLKGSPRTLTCPASTAPVSDPTNNPPVAVPIPTQYGYLNTPFTYTLPAFSHEDGQTLLYAISGGIAGLAYNQATRTFSGLPNQIGTFTASLVVSDGQGGYTPALVTVVVTAAPANSPPVVAKTVADQSAKVGQAFSLVLDAGTFTDPDNNLSSVQVSGLPGGLSYSSSSRLISGQPTTAGTVTVTLKATDGLGATATTTFKIAVAAADAVVNKPPVVSRTIPNLTATAGQPFAYTIAEDSFSDSDGTIATVELTSPLPSGLTYTRTVRSISGTPTLASNNRNLASETMGEATTVTVKATDDYGDWVTTTFQLTINPAPAGENRAPVVAQPIPDQTATVGKAFAYAVGPTVFADVDGRIASVEVTGLPAGLRYDAEANLIAGTPTSATAVTVLVTATDNEGATVRLTFQLKIQAAPELVTGNFDGYLDKVECSTIRGWVWDRNKPNTPLTVEFYADGQPIGSVEAAIFRGDLLNAGKGNGNHAYSFTTPASLKDNKPHEISARVLNSAYTLKYAPKTLTCPSSARLSAESVEGSWGAFPNPFNDLIEISLPTTLERFPPQAPYRFTIVSTSGRQLLISENNTRVEAGKVILNMQPYGLSSGLYLLKIQQGEGLMHTLKVVK
ncbi:putative Ig domain-containing protein [Larkinella insperata]|uniref:Ig domain-containing protein n=1 Tax=Larkinella insperata TaxID=332158 RepID=A0ABW3Q4G9_9BACT|nr:putative Ig domain-containing protein [Larkinella insperata]